MCEINHNIQQVHEKLIHGIYFTDWILCNLWHNCQMLLSSNDDMSICIVLQVWCGDLNSGFNVRLLRMQVAGSIAGVELIFSVMTLKY